MYPVWQIVYITVSKLALNWNAYCILGSSVLKGITDIAYVLTSACSGVGSVPNPLQLKKTGTGTDKFAAWIK